MASVGACHGRHIVRSASSLGGGRAGRRRSRGAARTSSLEDANAPGRGQRLVRGRARWRSRLADALVPVRRNRSKFRPDGVQEETMAIAVGIDLGTTNSVIATTEAGKPTVIPNAEGSRTTPSVVAFTAAGRAARRPAGAPPGHLEPEGHDLLSQAVHRTPLRRGHQRARTPSRSTSSPAQTAAHGSRSTASSTRPRKSPRWCCASSPRTRRSSSARR